MEFQQELYEFNNLPMQEITQTFPNKSINKLE